MMRKAASGRTVDSAAASWGSRIGTRARQAGQKSPAEGMRRRTVKMPGRERPHSAEERRTICKDPAIQATIFERAASSRAKPGSTGFTARAEFGSLSHRTARCRKGLESSSMSRFVLATFPSCPARPPEVEFRRTSTRFIISAAWFPRSMGSARTRRPLAAGLLEGHDRHRPRHGWQFDVCSGKTPLGLKITQPVYEVRIEGDDAGLGALSYSQEAKKCARPRKGPSICFDPIDPEKREQVTRFRRFRNTDPPALARLWNQAIPQTGTVRPLRIHELDTRL